MYTQMCTCMHIYNIQSYIHIHLSSNYKREWSNGFINVTLLFVVMPIIMLILIFSNNIIKSLIGYTFQLISFELGRTSTDFDVGRLTHYIFVYISSLLIKKVANGQFGGYVTNNLVTDYVFMLRKMAVFSCHLPRPSFCSQ